MDALSYLSAKVTVCSEERPEGCDADAVIQSMDERDTDSPFTPAPPGFVDNRRYFLAAPPDALRPGECGVRIWRNGAEYELIRAELLYVGETPSHWEGVVRKTGRCEGDA